MKLKALIKKMFSCFTFILLASIFSGCGNGKNSENNNNIVSNSGSKENEQEIKQETASLSLLGKWKNEGEKDNIQEAIITEDKIEINWVSSEDNSTKGLYWVGTYEAPNTTEDNYSWTSKGDTEKMKTALLASRDETKEFEYKNGILSYEVTAFGITKKIQLKRTS